MRIKILILFSVLFFSVRLYANPLVIRAGFCSVNVNQNIQFLTDKKGTITCQDILSGKYNNQFYATPNYSVSLGYSNLAHWAKVELQNESDITKFVLEIENVYLDSVDFFEIRNRDITAKKNKHQLFYNPNISSVRRSTLTHTFQLDKGKKVVFLIRFRSATTLNLPILFYTDLEFQNHNAIKQGVYAVSTGIIFFVLMFSLFLYFTIRENIYLYYCGYTLAFWFSILGSNGYLYAYLPLQMRDVRLVSSIGIVTFMLLFTRDFLAIRKLSKTLFKIIKILFWLLGVCVLVYLMLSFKIIDIVTNQQVFNFVSLLYYIVDISVFIVVIASIIAAIRRKYLPGWFYLIALTPILILIFTMVLSNLAFIPFKKSFDSQFVFAYLFEISVLCLGMTFRFKLYKDSQQKLLIDNNKKEREILTSLIAGQEMERKRIAEELHDSLGQGMAVIKLKLENLNLLTPQLNGVEDLKKDIDESIKELRNISYNMMPVALINNGLDAAIKDLIGNINVVGQIQIEYHSDPKIYSINNNQIEITIYRIIQEALTNIVKHAQARFASVQITSEDACLQIMIEDDGVGFDVRHVGRGKGLKNISSRVQLINGHLEINSEVEQGTVLFIEFPLPQ